MTTTRQIDLTVNKLTKAQYEGTTPNADEFYVLTDDIGITSADIINALGYTPYNATNPNGYVTALTLNNYAQKEALQTSFYSANINADGLYVDGTTGLDGNVTCYANLSVEGTFTVDNKTLAAVAFSGDYNDLINAPGGGGTITVDQVYDSTSANAQSGVAINGAGFLTSSSLNGYATQSWVTSQGYTTNTGTVTSVNNVQPVNGNVTISIPDVSNFVTNSSLATTLDDYVKSSVENTTQGTTATIGYVSGFAPVMQLTYGNYQMLCGCAEGAILSMLDTTTNIQTAISAIPAGIAIKQGQQQALLSLSNNNLLVNGSELATQSWVGQQGYITGINSSDVTTALGYTPVDINMSNISTAGKIAITNIGYPTTTSKTISLQSSGSSYTAPADGWVHITLALNIDGYVAVNSVYSQGGTASGAYSSVFYPVSKGETFTVSYANRASTPRFRFYYAKGTESEAS